MAASIGPGGADRLARRGALGDEHELAVAGADGVDGDERLALLVAGGVGRAHEHQRDGPQGVGLDGGHGLADHTADDHRRIVGTRLRAGLHPACELDSVVSWPAGDTRDAVDPLGRLRRVPQPGRRAARRRRTRLPRRRDGRSFRARDHVRAARRLVVRRPGARARRHDRRAPDDRAARAAARRVRPGRRRLVHRARRDLPAPAPDVGQIHELGMRAASRSTRRRRPPRCARPRARPTCCCACRSTRAGAARSFIEASIERLGELRALLRPGMGLEVDGGVGPETIARCRAAGANLMVAGSAIYGQPSPGEAWTGAHGRRRRVNERDAELLDRALDLAERGRRRRAPTRSSAA